MFKNIFLLLLPLLALCSACKPTPKTLPTIQPKLLEVQFNADSTFHYIQEQCNFGPRVPNSTAHEQCRQYIVRKFRDFGMDVTEQQADLKAWDGNVLHSTNIIASYLPQVSQRIVLAAHWDCRPWCDADPDSARHHDPVMGANDGASGVAVLLELARQIRQYNDTLGIDFVCFDAEDYGAPYWAITAGDETDWCLGSRYWAKNLPAHYQPKFGILLDMVGAPHSEFKLEYYSMQYAQDVIAKVWAAADVLQLQNYFVPEQGGAITDDHIEMNRYGKIPTIDIIGTQNNNFPSTWHTVNDTPQHISKETLKAVGQTLMQVIFDEMP